MLKLTIERPNTIGVTYSEVYETYADAENKIERYIERRADQGWQASEYPESTSLSGAIELTHDYVADLILIQWETIRVAE